MKEKKEKAEVQALPIIPTAQSSKMRIRLYESGNLTSDRLVEQSFELKNGPKEPHKGPLSVEFNFADQEQIELAIEWIRRLKGDLPLVLEAKKSSTKKLDKMLSEKEPLLDLLKLIKSKPSQENVIDCLREYNFKFLTYQSILDFQEGLEIPKITIKESHKDYQFMARLIKEAKNPELDKYDFRLTVGIKLVGERVDKVKIYLWGEFAEQVIIPWQNAKKINFKKVDLMFTFPEWMDLDDRKKWRVEHRKWRAATEDGKNPDAWPGFSKAYLKAQPYIKKLG